MTCPRCQKENSGDAVFCQECGTRLETACPSCGTANQLGAKFCKKCGQRLSGPQAEPVILLGERERGLECLTRVLEKSTGIQNTPRWHHYATVTASAYLAAGCPEEARAEIRQGLAAATENAWGHRAPWLRVEAEVLAQGDPAGARERLEEALALAEELEMRPEVAHCHLGLSKLYRRTGDHAKAAEHLTTARAMYGEMDMEFWLTQAEAACAGGDP
jgi:tetratricopeptide (TPR) repeat protein